MSFHSAVKGARRKFFLGLVAAVSALAAVMLGIGQAAPASASAGQRWIDFQTGLCLDSNYNGNAYTGGCNGGNYQNWHIYDLGLYATIVDAQTGLYLDSNYNGNIYTGNGNGGNYQGWY